MRRAHREGLRAGGAARGQAGRGVLDDEAARGGHAERARAGEVRVRVRLAAGDVGGGDEPRGRERHAAGGERARRVDVRGGGDDRPGVSLGVGVWAAVLDLRDEVDCAWERDGPALDDLFFEARDFGLAECVLSCMCLCAC